MATPLDIRRTRSVDGVEIAYRVLGSGPALVVLLPYHVMDLVLNWAVPVQRRAMERLARTFTVIPIDLRGVGQSERNPRDVSMDLFTSDVEAVLTALGVERASIVAGGNASKIACYIASRIPEKVERLALYGPADSSVAQTLHALRHVDVDAQADMRASMIGGLRDPGNTEALATVFRGAVDADAFDRFAAAAGSIDVDAVLARVQAPTLFVHGAEDVFTPLATAQRMAALIPNAELRLYPGSSPLIMWGHEALRDICQHLLGGSVRAGGRSAAGGLTPREVELLLLVAQGKTNQQIADELVISLNTVRHHLKSIFLKTGATNRTEAASFARSLDLS